MSNTIDLQAIIRGLSALAGLMQVPEVRTTVAGFHADFRAASQQIDVMGDYKDVHDDLHVLQFLCYNDIVTRSSSFPNDASTVDILMYHEQTFHSIVARLQVVATRLTLTGDELTWIQDLVQAQGRLRQAIETLDPASLKGCCRLIRRVLDRYPSLINARLTAAARALRMETIVQAMTAIQQEMPSLDLRPGEVQAFELSVSSLADLSRRLTALVRDHDRWQDVDVQFRGIEAGIDQDLETLEMSWSDLQTRIAPLAADESQEWVHNLRRNGSTLDGALTNHDQVNIRKWFRLYRRAAGERFFQVDTELKDLCGQLRAIGVPLATVAQLLAALEPLPVPAGEGQPAGRLLPEERASQERQLAELRGNLRLIVEHKAKFVLETDVPPQFEKDERRLRERIAAIEASLTKT